MSAAAAISRHVFYSTASPAQILDRIAYYRDRIVYGEPVVVIATAGPFALCTIAGHEGSLRNIQCHCPYKVTPIAHIAAPAPRELLAYLDGVMRPHRARGVWYHREPVEPLLDAIVTREAPEHAPPVPELPDYMHAWPEPTSTYQRKLQRAEALAYVRGLLEDRR
jgi:hypothetical protein